MNGTNGTNTTQAQPANPIDTARQIVGWVNLASAVIGTPLNLYVMYLAALLIRTRDSYNNQIIVVSMAAADFLNCAVTATLMFLEYNLHIPHLGVWCGVMYTSTYCTFIASSLSLLLLNIDKFILLNKPLHYAIIWTRRKIVASVVLVWIIAIACTVLFLFGPAINKAFTTCNLQPLIIEAYVTMVVVFFILPVLASLVVSCYIVTIVVRTQRRNEKRRALTQKPSNTAPALENKHSASDRGLFQPFLNADDDNQSAQTTPRQNNGKKSATDDPARLGIGREDRILCRGSSSFNLKKKIKTIMKPNLTSLRSIAFVFITTLWSTATTLPYRITYAYYTYNQATIRSTWSHDEQISFYLVSFTLFSFLPVNPAGNPIITIVTQRSYMQRHRWFMRRLWAWLTCKTYVPGMSDTQSTVIGGNLSVFETNNRRNNAIGLGEVQRNNMTRDKSASSHIDSNRQLSPTPGKSASRQPSARRRSSGKEVREVVDLGGTITNRRAVEAGRDSPLGKVFTKLRGRKEPANTEHTTKARLLNNQVDSP